jgi:hypothetical protein
MNLFSFRLCCSQFTFCCNSWTMSWFCGSSILHFYASTVSLTYPFFLLIIKDSFFFTSLNIFLLLKNVVDSSLCWQQIDTQRSTSFFKNFFGNRLKISICIFDTMHSFSEGGLCLCCMEIFISFLESKFSWRIQYAMESIEKWSCISVSTSSAQKTNAKWRCNRSTSSTFSHSFVLHCLWIIIIIIIVSLFLNVFLLFKTQSGSMFWNNHWISGHYSRTLWRFWEISCSSQSYFLIIFFSIFFWLLVWMVWSHWNDHENNCAFCMGL